VDLAERRAADAGGLGGQPARPLQQQRQRRPERLQQARPGQQLQVAAGVLVDQGAAAVGLARAAPRAGPGEAHEVAVQSGQRPVQRLRPPGRRGDRVPGALQLLQRR
jgi:hypothetical protein